MKWAKLLLFCASLVISGSALSQSAIVRGEQSPGVYVNLQADSGKNLIVTSGGYSYSNITTAATTLVKTGAGDLHCVSVNSIGTTFTITIYDNVTAAVPKIATSAAVTAIGTLCFDVAFTTGLTIVTGGTPGDITVSYR